MTAVAIWTTILSVLIWTAFHFASMPLTASEVPIIVGVSALVVYGVRQIVVKLRKGETKSGTDQS